MKTTKTTSKRVVVQQPIFCIHLTPGHLSARAPRTAVVTCEQRALTAIGLAIRAGYDVTVVRRFV